MRIDISEHRVSANQCDSIIRSLSEAITNSLNFKSEESYSIEIHLDICKSEEDEGDVIPNDIEARISDLENRFRELAIQNLNDKLKKIMEDPSRHTPCIYPLSPKYFSTKTHAQKTQHFRKDETP